MGGKDWAQESEGKADGWEKFMRVRRNPVDRGGRVYDGWLRRTACVEIQGNSNADTCCSTSQYHNESVLKKYQERLLIGKVEEKAKL